jgi:hypothetical protein
VLHGLLLRRFGLCLLASFTIDRIRYMHGLFSFQVPLPLNTFS